jgi:uncharacterized protein DUF1360
MGLFLILAALATWRLAHLLTAEDGPGGVVVHLRGALGDSAIGRAMDCFYCLSLWIAAPFTLFATQDFLTWLVAWLATSGAACLLERATSHSADHQTVMRAERTGGSLELLRTATPNAANASGPPTVGEG